MADLMLMSSANGTWEYEILENKVKVKHKITKGLNEIDESHVETLEADPGYQSKVKRGVYKILKGGKELTNAKKADSKPIDDAGDADAAKEAGKAVINDLKKKHAAEIKDKTEGFTAANQKLVEAKGEALREVKELKEKVTSLNGEKAQEKADFESLIKTLENEKSELSKTVEKQAAEIKKFKAKA